MFDLDKNQTMMVVAGLIVSVVVIYLLITYHIKSVLRGELKKMTKRKKKNDVAHAMQQKAIMMREQRMRQQESLEEPEEPMDSYVEPQVDELDLENDPPARGESKMNPQGVMMRDMMDGAHELR